MDEHVELADKNDCVELTVDATIKCSRCGQMKAPDRKSRHMCVDCARVENNRYNYVRMHQDDWMAAAADAGVDVWLQQPGETQFEYTIWCAYRDSYPGRKPTYGAVAAQCDTTYEMVRRTASRWTFQPRMQAWMAECDRMTMAQRRDEIIHMNAEHISMAQRLRDKLSMAIDLVDPAALKPSDIASLAKLSAEMERKARTDTMAQDEMRLELLKDTENPELKKSPTKASDLSEVVSILLGAGALGSITQIGVRQTETKTTEVVALGGDE